MWSPPMWTLRSGFRACRSNSRGAFATCSSTKSGSSFTFCSSTCCPCLRKRSSASSLRNSTPRAQLRRRPLGKPDSARVVAEVVVAKLGMTVESEAAGDDAVERAHEEVREEVDARLVLGAVDLVAVRAVEAPVAVEIGTAVRVRDDDLVAGCRLGDRCADPLG